MKNFIFIIILLGVVLAVAYLFNSKPTPESTQTVQHGQTDHSIGQRTKEDDCVITGPYQDKACTPGAVFPDVTAEQICVRGYSKSVRHVPAAEKREVYEDYGITHHGRGEYEVDHLISLELGGSNDIANLWPEAAEPRPGFHEKDKVENYLHAQVCSGRIALKEAQWEIANEWLAVYKSMDHQDTMSDDEGSP